MTSRPNDNHPHHAGEKNSMRGLAGKVAVVTGGSRGIGRAICLDLARAGASVVVSSRKQVACEQVVAEIREGGGDAQAIAHNVSDIVSSGRLVEQTLALYGRLDILICNAAVNPYWGAMASMPEEAYDKVMEANVKSNFLLGRAAAHAMAARGGGSIVIISSLAGFHGSETLGIYGVSKAADFSLARSMAVEWGPRGVRANCVAPGLIQTDMSKALWENSELRERVEHGTPLRRMGQPEDIASVVRFLVGDGSSYITGQVLVVDGGLAIKEPA